MSHRICRFAALMLSPFLIATVARAQGSDKAQAQHFVCHKGFTLARCQSRMGILRGVLNHYHADELGEWSWVLVRTTDWEELLSVRGFDARTPAFTYLPAHETFFDDALTTRDSIRGMQLTMIWQLSIDELLDKAVRHELAHAFCREKDEFKARVLEDRFRTQTPLVCGSAKHRQFQ
jgi:hypothetical protein